MPDNNKKEKRITYPVGFYFRLIFSNNKDEDAAFQEVSGLSKEMAIEEVTSGGENRFRYRLPATPSVQNLILKRAMVPAGSNLIKWCADCLDNGFSNPIIPKLVTLQLLDARGSALATWAFHKAYPVKYIISDFRSQENDIVIETIELAYTYFELSGKK